MTLFEMALFSVREHRGDARFVVFSGGPQLIAVRNKDDGVPVQRKPMQDVREEDPRAIVTIAPLAYEQSRTNFLHAVRAGPLA